MSLTIFQRIISLLLTLIIVFSLIACSGKSVSSDLSDPNEQMIVESIDIENILAENTISEFITEEIYLNEIIIAEDKIAELLLEESTINEVLLCKVIYVPQDHIEEFSANSQTAQLFDSNLDLSNVLTKVAVGSGIICTLVILKVAELPEPIASIVVAAANESLQFAGTGAAVGTLFGGLSGMTDSIDPSGRTSAIIAFATATVGLILSIISLVALIPSEGSSSITAALGAKLVFAGVSVLAASAGTVYAGINAVKTFTSTDASEIDWECIDWEKLGVTSAQKAIGYGADGYMWGAIVGAVHGGVDGYEFYHKFNTPYTNKIARLNHTPKDGKLGKWTGKRGESKYVLNEPINLANGDVIKSVTYHNGVPDFSPFMKAEVKISGMSNARPDNFSKADEELADHWSKIKYGGKKWTAREIEIYRKDNNLSWHEMSNMEYMQLVPTEVNQTFTHFGGVAEYNAMIGQEGVTGFD